MTTPRFELTSEGFEVTNWTTGATMINITSIINNKSIRQKSSEMLHIYSQPCSWSAQQGKLIFPCPRSRRRIWSRETGSAAPSRVSLLILHTQAESGACLRDSSRVPWRRPFIYIKNATRHRVSPEFIGPRKCVPMAFTAESPPAQRQ